MGWQVFIALFGVMLSYILVPKKPILGWALGVIGNALYILVFLHFHRIDVELAPVIFTLLSLWNLWHELRKKSTI
jgi:nicotinamide riboside transporter PnuC